MSGVLAVLWCRMMAGVRCWRATGGSGLERQMPGEGEREPEVQCSAVQSAVQSAGRRKNARRRMQRQWELSFRRGSFVGRLGGCRRVRSAVQEVEDIDEGGVRQVSTLYSENNSENSE